MPVVNLDDELERLDRVILAAEDWAKRYRKQPKYLTKLIKFEARLDRVLRKYFRQLANERLDKYINWNRLNQEIQAYKFDVTVDVDLIEEDEYDELINIVHDPLQISMALGAQSAEEFYNIDLGLNQYHEAITKAASTYTADLVKGVTNTTKDRIRQSINTSIQLGEDIASARERLMSVIDDPRRAQMIARTESVRSYSKGITVFGAESNATGQIWEISSNPCEICASNDVGEIPFGEDFPSGDSEPPAHPNCRCSISLVHDYS